MKLKLFLLIAVACNTLLLSQKTTVAITSFEATTPNIPEKYIKAIEERVKESFYATNRFDLVDRTNLKKIKEEKELQKTEDFLDGNTVRQMRLEGAERIVAGNVNMVSITKEKTKTSFYYDCKISFSLNVIDLETGQVLASKLIRPKQNIFQSISNTVTVGNDTPETAFFNELKGTQKEINKFVNENFPVTTFIIEITEASSSKAKVLLLNTGLVNGTKKNQEFSVVEISRKKVGGKELVRKKEIGKIKVISIQGDELSEAKVIKGGEAILNKFNSGAKIECHSKTR